MLVTIKKPIETSAGTLFPGPAPIDASGWANLPLLLSSGYVAPVLAESPAPIAPPVGVVEEGGAPLETGEPIGSFLPPVGDESPLAPPDADTITPRQRTPRGRR